MENTSIPYAIDPIYLTSSPNEPVALYEGNIDLQIKSRLSPGTGKLQLIWQPKFSIHLECTHTPPMTDAPWIKVRLPGQQTFFDVGLYSMGIGVDSTGAYGTAQGSPREMYWAVANKLDCITFHIPNFLSFVGSAIVAKETEELLQARAAIQTQGWLLEIDAIGQYGILDQDRLEKTSGNLITHVGRISRSDGSQFTVEEGKDFLDVLYGWLSFCRGNWVAPILAVGLDSSSQQVWKHWRDWTISRSEDVPTWSNRTNADFLEQSLAGFHNRLLDPAWKEAIQLGIHWYIECNRRASGLEAAIILGQTGLELLGWTYLVENLKTISIGGFNELPAADKVRLLLAKCDIPLEIPVELRSLAKLAKTRSWKDGPECLVALRNALIHPQAKNRKSINTTSSINVYEVWNLGSWYLELVLLRLFDYKGVYRNRLKRECTYDQALEKVPWSR